MSTLLLVCATLLLVSFLLAIVNHLRRRRREKLSAAELGPIVVSLTHRLNMIDKGNLTSELKETKERLDASYATLLHSDKVINRCPNCQSTLTVRRTTYYGTILGCPKYPACRYMIKLRDLSDLTFGKLRVG